MHKPKKLKGDGLQNNANGAMQHSWRSEMDCGAGTDPVQNGPGVANAAY